MREELMKYRKFQNITAKVKDVVALVRGGSYGYEDEGSFNIVICPECEDWTHVTFNLNSCLLDLLGELTVESIDAVDNDIRIWIKTDDFNRLDMT